MCDPAFRAALARHGYSLDLASGEVAELAPYVGAFSARTAQIRHNVERYEAEWRADHPHQEPGPKLRQAWDRRAWATARPDKVVPQDGAELAKRWIDELHGLGFQEPRQGVTARRHAGRSAPPRRAGRDGPDAARQQAVGVERGRHPRRDGAADRRSRSRHRSSGPARAGRGPHRPRHRSVHPAAAHEPMSPNTSDPSPHHRSSRSRTASPPRSPLAPSSRSPPGTRPSRRRSTTHRRPFLPR